MKELTADQPKPLLIISGRPIIYYALDLCKLHAFKRVVINTHYLPEQIIEAVNAYRQDNPGFPEVMFIHEERLLETGGGIKNARSAGLVQDEPIFVLNTDVILRSANNILADMLEEWQPLKMDFLLLLQDLDKSVGYCGDGDFELEPNGRVSRTKLGDSYSLMYTGLAIVKPDLIAQNLQQQFSLREYYLNHEKVFGLKAQNMRWYHATKPEDVEIINDTMT